MYIEFEKYGKNNKLSIVLTRYQSNGNRAICLVTDNGEPYVVMTVNIDKLPDNQVCLDTNNFPDGEKIMRDYEFGVPVDVVQSGWCLYPIYEINIDNIRRYCNE